VKEVPIINAWNKADAVADPAALYQLAAARPNTVAVSGASGAGLERLLETIAGRLQESMTDMEVRQRAGNPDSSCWPRVVDACGLICFKATTSVFPCVCLSGRMRSLTVCMLA
jgi:50S ribosomal subunit-associated GTPase HflX